MINSDLPNSRGCEAAAFRRIAIGKYRLNLHPNYFVLIRKVALSCLDAH